LLLNNGTLKVRKKLERKNFKVEILSVFKPFKFMVINTSLCQPISNGILFDVCTSLNNGQTVQECDATILNRITKAD
jgi:hypothetical protein